MSNPVLALLKEKGIPYSISGKDYVTKCFNPDHDDKSPSFRIDKTTGIAHCFSCSYKTNIFKFYGLLTNNVSIRVAKLKEKLKELSVSANGLDPLDGAKPYTKTYRGISIQTLKTFGAFYTENVESMVGRIVFPIKDIRNKTIAYVGRNLLSDSGARYLNYPANAAIPLYPVKFAEKFTSIILVEGLFDMLNLYDKGIHNVVCTFGTAKLLNDISTKMLSYKVAGIERVFILYDGDTSGRDAAEKMKPLLEDAGFITEIISLPDDVDPGIMDDADLESIKEYIR